MLIVYVSVIVLLLTWLVVMRWRAKKTLNLPPGPRGLPIVGYLPWIDAIAPHESLTTLTKKYGPICGLWMGSVYTVLLSDPKIVRQTLARDTFSGRAPLYLTHGIMKGYGIICAEGQLWNEQRRFVTTTLKNIGMVKFGSRRDKIEQRVLRSVTELIEKLRERSINGVEIDPLETLHHCIGNFMNDIVFGKVYEEDDETWKWLRFLQEDGVKHIGIAGPLNFLPFLRYIPRFNRVMNFLIEGKLKTHKVYKKLINEHEENPAKSDNFLAAFSDEIKKRNKSGYDVGSFTEQQYYHLLADIFGAGTDTGLMTIRWFLLYMAVYPDQQEIIYQEIIDNLGERQVSLNDRPTLIHLEAAICEVQRIRSIVPLGIPHGCLEDSKINEFDIPRGTMVVPLLWSIHMNPEYFENPDEFQHERFINPDGTLEKPEAFIPYQTGKRVCVGDELARIFLFLYAGTILKNFKISIPNGDVVDLRGDIGITLIPKPHKLVFSSRV